MNFKLKRSIVGAFIEFSIIKMNDSPFHIEPHVMILGAIRDFPEGRLEYSGSFIRETEPLGPQGVEMTKHTFRAHVKILTQFELKCKKYRGSLDQLFNSKL